jgi:hypothetical protein
VTALNGREVVSLISLPLYPAGRFLVLSSLKSKIDSKITTQIEGLNELKTK